MDLGLDGKLVLVTGGSKGIGLACAAGFLAEGARVGLASARASYVNGAILSMDGAATPIVV